MLNVAIAGANGFIGKTLVRKLKKSYTVVALSRRPVEESGVKWQACDLFNMRETEDALTDIHTAIYTAHTIRPSARLTQAHAADLDLIMADNFVRAARKKGVQRIIYIGRILSEQSSATQRSRYLRSREEIEEVFRSSGIATTFLKAGLILGIRGAAFQMLSHLPLKDFSDLRNSICEPLSVETLADIVLLCLQEGSKKTLTYEIAGEERLTYFQLLERIENFRKQNLTYTQKFSSGFDWSIRWLQDVSGAPWDICKNFYLSIKGSRGADDAHRFPLTRLNPPPPSLEETLKDLIGQMDFTTLPEVFQNPPVAEKQVRSVQRFLTHSQISAEEAAQAYLRFLPLTTPGFLKVDVEGKWIYFCLRFPRTKLLVLEYSAERSTPDRQLFYVRGGLFAKKKTRGRLEFREVLEGRDIIAAIHDFQPRLPWNIYRWSQAVFHLLVMKQFGHYLQKGLR